ncbi:hypothetical protein EOD23_07910 [Mesorhizobium sp. USDA-HM6]|nr:hypothetical protein EOD23_07910 [Mesorhizobium sp. USDA-HM6]
MGWRDSPPLACRPSPPLGGRSDVAPAFANLQRCRISGAPKPLISPLVGEISGPPSAAAAEDGQDRGGREGTRPQVTIKSPSPKKSG